jgi:hypothetical protein
MPDEFEIDWYTEDLVLVLDEATDDIVTRLVIQGVAYAKVNIQADGLIDTGFMLNAVYALTPKGAEGSPQGDGYYTNKEGQRVYRAAAGAPGIEPHAGAIHAAANYTIYQEMKHNFLYRALDQLRSIAPGVIETVGRERFNA